MEHGSESFLQVMSGSATGRKQLLRRDGPVTVGCGRSADLSVPDGLLDDLHFAIEPTAQGYQVRDLGSARGIHLNGALVSQQILCNGDEILAGFTHFSVRLAGHEVPSAEAGAGSDGGRRLQASRLRLWRVLTQESLYAVLDAARDWRVLELLRASDSRYESLMGGARAEELADFSPYLVQFRQGSSLLESLVRDAWGESWGMYCACPEPFAVLHDHLQNALWAETPDGRMLFRFYDPRVLRGFLPTCAPQTARSFFGPVQRFLMEGDAPNMLLEFRLGPDGVECEAMDLGMPTTPADDNGAATDTDPGSPRPKSGLG